MSYFPAKDLWNFGLRLSRILSHAAGGKWPPSSGGETPLTGLSQRSEGARGKKFEPHGLCLR